jgi:uncharacterized membrane protein
LRLIEHGLSPMVGLILNSTLEIRLTSITFTLLVLTIVLSTLAIFRIQLRKTEANQEVGLITQNLC